MKTLAVAAALGAACSAIPAHADVVSDWSELQTTVSEAEEQPQAVFDPSKISVYGRLMLAMFEAANAIDPKYESYLGLKPAPRGTPIDPAVAIAAHTVLIAMYPGQKSTLDDALTLTLGTVPAGTAREDAMALGKRAAKAAMDRGGWDEKAKMSYYRPTGPVGRWAPSNVPHPPELTAARPWFLTSQAQFRIAEPPPLASTVWADSFNEVKRMGERTARRAPRPRR